MTVNNNVRKKSRIKINGFGKFLLIYSGVFILVIAILLILLHGLLKDYEQGIPDTTMEKVIENFNSDSIGELVTRENCGISEFETTDYVIETLKDYLKDEQVTFKRKAGEYTNSNPVYLVLARNEQVIAKVKLSEDGVNGHKFTKWKLGEISFDGVIKKDKSIKIKAPENSIVRINGVEVATDYVTSSGEVVKECQNVGEFTSIPTSKIITVDNLMQKPNVTVSLGKTELNLVWNDDSECTAMYSCDDDTAAAITQIALEAGRTWGQYIINKGSLAKLQSYMVGRAKALVSDIPAVWAYVNCTYQFKNEKVTDIAKYSDTCVSCKVHYDLEVHWTYNGSSGIQNYPTDITFIYVKTNGGWYVADFMTNRN